MNKSNSTLASKKGMSTLARPKFAPGMLLQHEDLEQLNYYTRDLSRLMFRSLFGCGVMCGLVVTTDAECGKLKLNIGSGVALSCSGDPIEVPNVVSVLLDRDCHPEMGETLWITLCGTVKCCAPRTSMCESDDDETKSECTRERDGYEIRVEPARPPCICGCPAPTDPGTNPTGEHAQGEEGKTGTRVTRDANAIDCKCAKPDDPCYEKHYAGECGCHCDDCDDCDCKCVLLARLDFDTTKDAWVTDHSVRRFVRPVLMRDPQVEKELLEKADQGGTGGGGGGTKPTPPPPPPVPVPVPPVTGQPVPQEEPPKPEAEEEPPAGKAGSKASKSPKKNGSS